MKNQLSSIWTEVSKRRKWTFPAASGIALLLIIGVMISTSSRSDNTPPRPRREGPGLADPTAPPAGQSSATVAAVEVEPLGQAGAVTPTVTPTGLVIGSDGRPILPARGQSSPRTVRPGSAYGGAPMTTRAFASDAEDCSIGITSKPWAQVWIDGRSTGRKTPIDHLKVACGNRKLTLRRPDQDLERIVMLKVLPGIPYRGDYDLQR
jgi:hypothetical protein